MWYNIITKGKGKVIDMTVITYANIEKAFITLLARTHKSVVELYNSETLEEDISLILGVTDDMLVNDEAFWDWDNDMQKDLF